MRWKFIVCGCGLKWKIQSDCYTKIMKFCTNDELDTIFNNHHCMVSIYILGDAQRIFILFNESYNDYIELEWRRIRRKTYRPTDQPINARILRSLLISTAFGIIYFLSKVKIDREMQRKTKDLCCWSEQSWA